MPLEKRKFVNKGNLTVIDPKTELESVYMTQAISQVDSLHVEEHSPQVAEEDIIAARDFIIENKK